MDQAQFEAFLAGFGLKLDDVQITFGEFAEKFPGAGVAKDAALAWFVANVTTPLSPATVIGAFNDAWAQLMGERPGYNPHHGRIA